MPESFGTVLVRPVSFDPAAITWASAESMVADAAELAVAEPAEFVLVTTERTTFPAWALVRTKDAEVAPAMSDQLVPLEETCHLYAVVVPSASPAPQVPAVVLSVFPTRGDPLSTGAAVLAGAIPNAALSLRKF